MIAITDSMFTSALNISWIYLVSVSVFFLFLFLLLSPQNLLTLVSYSSNFCIPSVYSKKSVCSHSNSWEAILIWCVPYVYISWALLCCMSTLYCPSLQTLLQIYHSPLWMHSPWKPSVTISVLFSPLSLILSLLLWIPYSLSFVLLFSVRKKLFPKSCGLSFPSRIVRVCEVK